MGRFQLESIYLETDVTSTTTRPVDNVVIATRGLQDRNTNIIAGTTVENKGKVILNKLFKFKLHLLLLILLILHLIYVSVFILCYVIVSESQFFTGR